MVRTCCASPLRLHIEATLGSAQGELDVDHYEVPLWQAWYRHIVQGLPAVPHAMLVIGRMSTALA